MGLFKVVTSDSHSVLVSKTTQYTTIYQFADSPSHLIALLTNNISGRCMAGDRNIKSSQKLIFSEFSFQLRLDLKLNENLSHVRKIIWS